MIQENNINLERKRASVVTEAMKPLFDLQRGNKVEPLALLQSANFLYSELGYEDISLLSSFLLTLKGKAYTIGKDFYPLRPMFKLRVPRRRVFKCGRQVAKSSSLAASTVLRGLLLPYHDILTIAPLYEQIRRYSNNYIKPFIEQSPFRSLVISNNLEQSVSQKTLASYSNLFFSFAFLDAERVRGISCRELNVDEVQDLDFTFLPVLRECMSASPYGPIETFSGTPKSFDNTIEQLWRDSSQAEWVMKCQHCNTENIPTIACGVLDMLQKHGFACKNCKKLLNPRQGNWVHMDNDYTKFAGYHIPQCVMPMHWEIPAKWDELLFKYKNYPQAKFLNEVLGESCDVGVKLVTKPQLIAACTLQFDNVLEVASEVRRKYNEVYMAVDWGGYGEEQTSYTTVAILAPDPFGNINVLYMERFQVLISEMEEVKRILYLWNVFKPFLFAHDFNGSGSIREVLLIQNGLPMNQIMPIVWGRATTKELVQFKQSSETSDRHYYYVDKTRAIGVALGMIKTQQLRFPNYKSCEDLLDDWLNIYEDKVEMSRGADIYLIKRIPKRTDDMVHAISFGCVSIWHSTGNYPNLASGYNALTETQLSMAMPLNESNSF